MFIYREVKCENMLILSFNHEITVLNGDIFSTVGKKFQFWLGGGKCTHLCGAGSVKYTFLLFSR